MATIKGQNLRVLVGGKCVAMATSMTLNIQTELQDASTKDDVDSTTGMAWAVQDIVGMSWDASCDSLVTLTDNGSNGELPADLLAAEFAGTLLTLVFDTTSGTNNRTANSSSIKMTGTAYISSLSITAQNRANSTITSNFTGTGALALG